MDSLPEYFQMWQLARWIGGGITPDDIEDMPVHKVMQAQIVMNALNRAEHEVNAETRKGRRKR